MKLAQSGCGREVKGGGGEEYVDALGISEFRLAKTSFFQVLRQAEKYDIRLVAGIEHCNVELNLVGFGVKFHPWFVDFFLTTPIVPEIEGAARLDSADTMAPASTQPRSPYQVNFPVTKKVFVYS